MSKRRKRKALPVQQGFAILLAFLGFLSLLGELGFTIAGKAFYNFLKFPFGEKVWLAPIVFFLLAIVCWLAKKTRSSQRVKTRVRTKDNRRGRTEEDASEQSFFDKGVELPKGKLVPLKGFQEYFSTDLELKPMEPIVELEDMGRNFDTYFKAGNDISFRTEGTRLSTVHGFEDYFNEVSSEIEDELRSNVTEKVKDVPGLREKLSLTKEREWEKPITPTHNQDYYPGQVSQLLKNDNTLSKGVSPEERAALLGKPPVEEWVIDKEPLIEVPLKKESPKVLQERIVRKLEDIPTIADIPTIHEDVLIDAGLGLKTTDNTFYADDANDDDDGNVYNMDITDDTDGTDIIDNNDGVEESIKLVEPACETSAEAQNKEEDTSEGTPQNQNEAKPLKNWHLPNFDLLDSLPQVTAVHDQDTQKNLEKVLEDFGVRARVIRVARGPVITRYELAPAPGVKISRIVNLADDIALGLAARDVRIEAPIPGKSAIGIEVPNKHPRGVPFREVLETPEFKEGSAKLRIALGKDIGNQSIVANLAKMPHLLVAGATGSGKSVCITSIINSLLFNARPDEVKFLMIDPKMVELSIYNGIPHLLAPVVTEPKKASAALKWVVKEMEARYELFAASGVRDIERYNQMKASEAGNGNLEVNNVEMPPAMPWIVVIIDELADLMMVAANEVEESICRLAQMARAAGIHLVIATQRPSVDVITGLIKANIPSRISFAVSSQIDSRTILDSTGAEKLLGRGDMLYSPQGINKPMRVQGCMITDDEVQKVISHWKAQGSPEYLDPEGFTNISTSERGESGGPDEELFVEAGRLIITTGMASVSYLQRKLKLGYARAARLIDMLEDEGIVGGYEGSKPRHILLTIEEFEERFG